MKNTSRRPPKFSRRSLLILLLVLIVTTVAIYFNFYRLITRKNNNSLDDINTALLDFKTTKEQFLNQLANAIQDRNARNTLNSVDLNNKLVAFNRTIDRFKKQNLSKLNDKQQSEINQLLAAVKTNNKEVLDTIIKPFLEGLDCNKLGKCNNINRIQEYFYPAGSRDIDGILGPRTISKVEVFLSNKINDSEQKLKLVSQKIETLDSAIEPQPGTTPTSSYGLTNLTRIIFLLSTIALLFYIYILSRKLKSIKHELEEQIRKSLRENYQSHQAYSRDYLKIKTEYDQKLNELEDKLKSLEKSLKTEDNSTTPGAIKITGALELPKIIKIDLPKTKLVEIYNDCPQVLSSSIVTVSLTADSYRQKTQGQIFLERVGHGNYWVIATKDEKYWLFPKSNITINIHQLKTVQFLFDCVGEYSANNGDFTLNQPASVAILPSGQEWKLEKKGRLVFGNDSPSSQLQLSHLEPIKDDNKQLLRKLEEI